MSEQNSNLGADGTFNIFGSSPDLGSEAVNDPFAVSDTPPVPDPFAVKNTEKVVAAVPELEDDIPTDTDADIDADSEEEDLQDTDEPAENPLAAAIEQAEKKQVSITADALFSKAPVFSYANANEDIADATITFEQLRVEKATDFPELDDGKRVSWSMEYCGITKQVPNPSKTVIGVLKKEIENSKDFLAALKKVKDKNPTCMVKPKITAQSKGIAAYKGIFPSLEEAEKSEKAICILPARNGNVYEMRRTEAGTFIARAEDVMELSEVSAGYIPALPPVPFSLFSQILSFFRHYMQHGHETEVMVHIYWDKERLEHCVVVPMQSVGKAHISVTVPPEEATDTARYIHVADIHSHNSMPAFFSGTDDKDERATRVYMVVGMLHTLAPQIRTRVSVGGRFVPIDARQLIDIPSIPFDSSTLNMTFEPFGMFQYVEMPEKTDFPAEWIAAVNMLPHVQSENTGEYLENPVKNRFFVDRFARLKHRYFFSGFSCKKAVNHDEF